MKKISSAFGGQVAASYRNIVKEMLLKEGGSLYNMFVRMKLQAGWRRPRQDIIQTTKQ
ncbi:MAG TPA: hypothetical protein VF172_13850 [Nitrososphaera sp.]|jgi:hypothetical protein